MPLPVEQKGGFFSEIFQCCGPREKEKSSDKGNLERAKPDISRVILEPEKPKTHFNTIILHFHGGGFVSGSSMSHQVYTRLWTKQLGVPIFSVDYKLSPEVTYPKGLDDCWQVYCWLRVFGDEFLSKKFNIP